MTYIQTHNQVSSRPNLDAPEDHRLAKILGASCAADTTRG